METQNEKDKEAKSLKEAPNTLYMAGVQMNKQQTRLTKHVKPIINFQLILLIVGLFTGIWAIGSILPTIFSQIPNLFSTSSSIFDSLFSFLDYGMYIAVIFLDLIYILTISLLRVLKFNAGTAWGFLPDVPRNLISESRTKLEQKIKDYAPECVKNQKSLSNICYLLLLNSILMIYVLTQDIPKSSIPLAVSFIIVSIATALFNIWLQQVFSKMVIAIRVYEKIPATEN